MTNKMKWPTVYEVASDIVEVDLAVPVKQRQYSGGKPVTEGLKPKPFPMKEGLHTVTPAQIASLEVPIITVGDEEIRGFQRDARDSKFHARKMAEAMKEGREFPPVMVSIIKDENGKKHACVSDGSHRSIAAIIARMPVTVVTKERTYEEAKVLFTDQRKSRKINSDQTILTGNSPLEEFIQDAITSDDHPWSGMISSKLSGGDRLRMTPIAAAQCIGAYTFDKMNKGLNYYSSASEKEFDLSRANELAELLQAFGNKTTNPEAFRSRSIKAITYAAIYIFHRNPATREGDRQRWREHMPKFNFGDYPHLLGKHQQLAQALVEHWNKRLPANRKVKYELITSS